jgi:hypothetical protein
LPTPYLLFCWYIKIYQKKKLVKQGIFKRYL